MKEITKEIKDYLLSVGYPDKEKIYYLEVWLWLWREKKIAITSELWYDFNGNWGSIAESPEIYNELSGFDDPEEAIITAIEHLVDNKLLE